MDEKKTENPTAPRNAQQARDRSRRIKTQTITHSGGGGGRGEGQGVLKTMSRSVFAHWQTQGWLAQRYLGGAPREQKMLKGHLPRVIYHQVY